MKLNQWVMGAGCAMAFALAASAFHEPQQAQLPNFDRRPANHVVRPERTQAAAAFKRQNFHAEVDFHPITGSVRFVGSTDRFLTMPQNGNDPHASTKSFLDSNRVLFGYGSEVLANANIKREFVTAHNQIRTVVWEQQLDGIAVFEGLLISHTTQNGELVNVSSHFLDDPAKAADAKNKNRAAAEANPPISAQEAIARAAEDVAEQPNRTEIASITAAEGAHKQQKFKSPTLLGDAEVHLVWLPTGDAAMVLCWEVTFTSRKRGEMFQSVLDAQTGEVVVRHCLTQYISPATYRVYTSDSPSPLSPGYSTPITTQPPLVSRSLVTLSAISTNASPNGWIDDGQNQTLGNNVDAHTDLNADNIADPGSRPQGSPARTFDFALDLNQAPLTYTNAAVVQLFYWNNFMHDRLYDLGFTEAAGNFQTSNYGRGGLGNDAVQADAQDGSGVNNANFSSPPDGSAGRMQMYVFTGPTPDRDGDLDAEVVLHEYTHGLSNRRVGGGVGISALQPSGMGEGWSDFYALSMLSESIDDVNGNYGAGAYASFLMSAGYSNNYYFGIRRYPYTTDMTKNPLTFKDIDPTQASTHTGIPKSPLGGSSASEVHNQGEVWCVTLWEVRAKLINKYGWSIGNQLTLKIVTDGMNLSVANPTFLQARDAILQADLVDNGGANRADIWAAFAKRGMGYFAMSPASSTTTGVVESYAVPDDLSVTPITAQQVLIGPIGGPFPTPTNYVLLNTGSNTLSWTATSSSTWLSISSSGGTLAPNASATLNVALTAVAKTLGQGIYSDTIRITNTTSGIGQTRQVTLRVGQMDYFTEQFTSADNDLDNITLTFTPNGSSNYYAVCRDVATNFPTDPLGGTNIALQNHATQAMTLTNGAAISIYGKSTNVLYVSSDGHITINTADSSGTATLTNHFSLPRVSGLFAHLHPADSGGAVYWQQLSNRVAVTFQRVQEYATTNYNSFQFELFFDGRIRLTWLALGTTTGLSGLSAGKGYPIDFVESDLSSYGACTLPLALTVPATVTEGDGVVGPTYVCVPSVSATDMTVALSSSDTNEVVVPANVTIAAGQTNASFNLTIVDDGIPDGTQVTTITASAAGFRDATSKVAVNDNDSANLQVIVPAQVTEGDAGIAASVSIDSVAQKNVQVNLSAGDPTQITVPASVIIPVGQTSAAFLVTSIDNHQIDGARDVSVTASVTNWPSASSVIRILDNEPTNLRLTLPVTASEAAGVLFNPGTVSISGTMTNDLVVGLQSADTNQIVVPDSVTIPAGTTSAVFRITMVDNAVVDGTRFVSITATNPLFTSASAAMQITDNESPAVPTNPTPADRSTNVIASTGLSWSSGEAVATNNNYSVYFGTNPTPGPAEFQGTTTNTSWTLPKLAPFTAYYWQIISARTGQTAGPVWQFTTRGVDHFVFDPISTTQYVGAPFAITVTAKDQFESTVSNFTGRVNLGAFTGAPTKTLFSDDFESGNLANWNSNTTSGITRAVTNDTANSGSYSLTVFGTTGGHYTGVWHPLSNMQPAQVSYAVRVASSNAALGYFVLAGNSTDLSNIVAFIYCYTNRMRVALDSAPSLEIPITTSAWIPVSLQFNWTNRTYRLYINNQLVSSAVPFRGAAVNALGTVNLYNFNAGQAWWDDVKFVNGPGSLPLAMAPTNSGSFVNGTWTGDVTVQQPATNALLNVSDSSGHGGTSGSFSVLLPDDLSITLTNSAATNVVGAVFTLNMNVATTGPHDSTHVTVTNFFPPSASVVGTSASQGTSYIDTNSSAVVFELGTVSPGTSANMSVTLSMSAGGVFTTYANVTSAEPDAYPTNNSASTTFTILRPALTIGNATVTEGNQGTTTNAIFNVTLSPAAVLPVQVDFLAGSLDADADIDFLGTNGTLLFAPGETNKTISVTVVGDNSYEGNEKFTVGLKNARNADISQSVGIGTILNDDLPPSISISDASVVEGNAGTANMNFVVTLSPASGVTASVDYHTVDGTATSPSDYIAPSPTTLTFLPGETQKVISIVINGDTEVESNETFTVVLGNQTGANLARNVATGTIIDDDTAAGVLDHFAWAPVPSPEAASEPFAVTVSARDVFGGVVTNFNGSVNLMSLDGHDVAPAAAAPFTNGFWSGWLTMASVTTNTTMLRASDSFSHIGDSNPFKVFASSPRVLSITTNEVGQTISWRAPASSFVLEYATDLWSPVWLPVTNDYIQINTNTISVSDQAIDAQRFYRLRR